MMVEIKNAYSRIRSEIVQMLIVEGIEEKAAIRRAYNIMAMLAGADILSRALKSPEPLKNFANPDGQLKCR